MIYLDSKMVILFLSMLFSSINIYDLAKAVDIVSSTKYISLIFYSEIANWSLTLASVREIVFFSSNSNS